MHKSGYVVLADGTVFKGMGLYEKDDVVVGELVFSTSMSGYSEVLTDPSFFGQIVILANPEVGNYGVNADDFQSDGIKVKALVVRNLSSCASSFRSEMTLSDFLQREHIPLIFGIDTRALIAHLRDVGSMMAAISTNPSRSVSELYQLARSSLPMEGMRLSSHVSVKQALPVDLGLIDIDGVLQQPLARTGFRIVVMDFGIKRSILRQLCHRGAQTILVPGDASPEEIWAHNPDGLFLSNGPGDPGVETTAIQTIKALLGKLPIFGVCLGHQILAQALGFSTYKLKFGHRGSNQAVRCSDGGIVTTAQNHGFSVRVSPQSLPMKEDINISDQTNEGIELPHLFAFSVQFHPEGAPGPHDSLFYFEKFMSYIAQWKKSGKAGGYAGDCLPKHGGIGGGISR